MIFHKKITKIRMKKILVNKYFQPLINFTFSFSHSYFFTFLGKNWIQRFQFPSVSFQIFTSKSWTLMLDYEKNKVISFDILPMKSIHCFKMTARKFFLMFFEYILSWKVTNCQTILEVIFWWDGSSSTSLRQNKNFSIFLCEGRLVIPIIKF